MSDRVADDAKKLGGSGDHEGIGEGELGSDEWEKVADWTLALTNAEGIA